mmetsp:Transcript_13512/g.27595  ORF Transcript_13512/g.27595 Transcript_13512/m.27595 type:complete len:174 (-) Transcript_13512:530-1051(-)
MQDDQPQEDSETHQVGQTTTDNQERPTGKYFKHADDTATPAKRAEISNNEKDTMKLSQSRLNTLLITWRRPPNNQRNFGPEAIKLLHHAHKTMNDAKQEGYYSANAPHELIKWTKTYLHLHNQKLLNPLYTTSGIFTEPDPLTPNMYKTTPPEYASGSTPANAENEWSAVIGH